MRRIQKIVNCCARVVTGRRRSDHVSDALELLGWLTTQQLVDFHMMYAVQRVTMSEEPVCLYALSVQVTEGRGRVYSTRCFDRA